MTVDMRAAHAVVAHMDAGQKRALIRFDARGAKAISDYRKAQLTARDLISDRSGEVVLTSIGVEALTIIREGKV